MRRREITVVGAGGYGEVLAELATKCGFSVSGFLDDDWANLGKGPGGVPVDGPIDSVLASLPVTAAIAVAIGDNRRRHEVMRIAWTRGMHVPSLVSPLASVSASASLADGSYLHDFSLAWTRASIGFASILSPHATVAHHASIGEGCLISVGASVGARVNVGNFTMLGMGATIATKVNQVAEGTILGAGAVAVKNILTPGTYIGLPATRLTPHPTPER